MQNPKSIEAKELYLNGEKLIDIANKLDVPAGTVRRWKSTYKWDNERSPKENERSHGKKNKRTDKNISDKIKLVDGTFETLQNSALNEKQQLFCIYYSRSFNAAQSYKKAYGCEYRTAITNGCKLLTNPNIKQEIERLKEIKAKNIALSESDIVEMHMRIAFSDIADYLSFGQEEVPVMAMYGPVQVTDEKGEKKTLTQDVNVVKFKESEEVDTQLIQEVKQGKNGTSVKLMDKQKSLEWLDKHFLYNPMDKHKIEFDMLRLELERQKIEPEHKDAAAYAGIPATMIAPAFAPVIFDITNKEHLEYVFPGGRGSTKSSFISLEVIDIIEKAPTMHACVMRQVADTLRTSVYQQMLWAIDALGLSDDYHATVSPLEITKVSTGQKIYFRGADDPNKIKSIKCPFGYIGIAWFEELDQFGGPEAVRKIEQSVIRGGDEAYIFKSFNPPKSSNNWANKYIKVPKANRLVTASTYLDVPKQWLGKPFLDEAEFLKDVNPVAYENEYIGIANGTGGAVFDNISIRAIKDEEIKSFDHILNGVDWGWYPDPFAFVRVNYEPAQHKLYVWAENTANKRSNEASAKALKDMGITGNDLITCDPAEKKSTGDFRAYGLLARDAEKGPGSREYSYKWLQSLNEIVVDNIRCPIAAEELLNYEYERDKDGNVISGYPDGNDHVIDAIRYATERIWKKRGQ